jgi:hypothetical protein
MKKSDRREKTNIFELSYGNFEIHEKMTKGK